MWRQASIVVGAAIVARLVYLVLFARVVHHLDPSEVGRVAAEDSWRMVVGAMAVRPAKWAATRAQPWPLGYSAALIALAWAMYPVHWAQLLGQICELTGARAQCTAARRAWVDTGGQVARALAMLAAANWGGAGGRVTFALGHGAYGAWTAAWLWTLGPPLWRSTPLAVATVQIESTVAMIEDGGEELLRLRLPAAVAGHLLLAQTTAKTVSRVLVWPLEELLRRSCRRTGEPEIAVHTVLRPILIVTGTLAIACHWSALWFVEVVYGAEWADAAPWLRAAMWTLPFTSTLGVLSAALQGCGTSRARLTATVCGLAITACGWTWALRDRSAWTMTVSQSAIVAAQLAVTAALWVRHQATATRKSKVQ